MTHAAQLIGPQAQRDADKVIGLAVRLELVRSIRGELSEPDWQALADEIRRVMGDDGQVVHLPGTLEWRHKDDYGDRTEVRISSGEGQTAMRLSSKRASRAALLFSMGPILGAFAGLAVGESLQLGMAVLAAGGGATLGLGGATVALRVMTEQWKTRMQTLADNLTRLSVHSSLRAEKDHGELREQLSADSGAESGESHRGSESG